MHPTFVLDASVALAWGFEDETTPYTERVLDALAEGIAIVPTLWPLEVTNALLTAKRRGRIKYASVIQFLSFLQMLPISVEPSEQENSLQLMEERFALAYEQGLSVYDATYLHLAMRRGLPLATLDHALKQAAKRCGVEIFQP